MGESMTQTFKVGDRVKHESRGAGELTHGPFRAAYSDPAYLLRAEDGREWVVSPDYMAHAPAFAVGDSVEYTLGATPIRGKIVAGPFKSEHHDELTWVVEKSNSTHMFPTGNALRKVSPADEPIKVGDRVRVVVDDERCDSGRYIDKVGRVTRINASNDRTPYRVEFGDGSGNHGDAENGAWWCTEVAKVTDEPSTSNTVEYAGKTYDLSESVCDSEGDRWHFAGRYDDQGNPLFGLGTSDDPAPWTLRKIDESFGL